VPPISWNYRIVQRRDGSFGLQEFFDDSAGEPWSMTANPARFECMADDRPAELAGALELALRDAREHPVFEEPSRASGPARRVAYASEQQQGRLAGGGQGAVQTAPFRGEGPEALIAGALAPSSCGGSL
jgi:hypothetical protein